MRQLFKKLLVMATLGHVSVFVQPAENGVRSVGSNMNEQVRQRASLFESVAVRRGFRILPGKYGGDFQSDQLAIQVANGKTTLLLGPLVTSSDGDLQLDMSSMGGHMQYSREWIIEATRVLTSVYARHEDAETILNSFKNGSLYLGAFLIEKKSGEVKLIRIETPKY